MKISYLGGAVVRAWLKNLVKALYKGPDKINISLNDFLNSIDPSKIDVVVKIGANDGIKNDVVTKAMLRYKWKGILVEPFESSFQLLKKNFENNDLFQLEQVGISDKDEQLDFYYLDNITADEPDWYDQVGSLDKQTFIKNVEIIPNYASRVRSRPVNCWTFDTLMTKHSLSKVDLIHIDTEGYDYKILRTIDLVKYKPRIIIFEYEWLSQFEVKEFRIGLVKNGYDVYFSAGDCIAVNRNNF